MTDKQKLKLITVEELQKLQMPSNLNAFNTSIEALQLIYEDESLMQNNISLFNKLSEKLHCNADRSIRTFLEKMTLNDQKQFCKMQNIKTMSPSLFITSLYYKCIRRLYFCN